MEYSTLSAPLISGINFYDDICARHYDALATSGVLPNPARLFQIAWTHVTTQVGNPDAMLDVGIGSGLSALPFMKQWPSTTLHGVDGSRLMLKQCRDKLPQARLSTLNLDKIDLRLPYDEAQFNLTLCQGTLYLLENATAVIREMLRVTRPGGIIAFNFEKSADSLKHRRLNDASKGRERQAVATWQHPLHEIMTAANDGGKTLYATTREVMRKMDDTPVNFTDIILQRTV